MSQLSHMYTFHHSHIHSSKKFVHGLQSPQLALQFMALQLWSLFCSSSVWSPSLILFFTNALALPVTALYTITQPLEAGLQLQSYPPQGGLVGRGQVKVQPCHLGPYALQPSRGFPITIFHDDQLPLLNCYWLLLFYILPLEQGSCCSRFSLSQAIVASGGD